MINRSAKNLLRYFTNIHRPGSKKNVFIFSSPRSGSTWLMELMLTQCGTKPCNEPFNIRMLEVAKQLEVRSWDELYSEYSSQKIRAHIDRYINGAYTHAYKNLRPFQKNYRFFTNRIIFKLLHYGEDRVNWFLRNFNGVGVFLIRHPLAVALSRDELPRLLTFLRSDYRRNFNATQLELAERIIDKGSSLERGVVDWCLQNAPLIKQVSTQLIMITYEQLVVDPENVLRPICRHCHFSDVDRMVENVEEPSGSVSKSNEDTRKFLIKGDTDRQWLIRKWRTRITKEQEKKCMAILKEFDMSVYMYGIDFPIDNYLIKNGY